VLTGHLARIRVKNKVQLKKHEKGDHLEVLEAVGRYLKQGK
jgi:hypothetical protein